ncbi:uncharacterized protein LOC111375984 [Olea europaea var. sylvestris]|uniref:uncharacterized protein LOC111375984 n=1 Tax=Olea europaea var. sylvestris TaxID=158386 RepID=UPI000C1D5EC5|nr:uncharacterized protein LOC111375984 [Olea europaea var. sylvestris]
MASSTESENFTTMSREFNALVLAGSPIGNSNSRSKNDVPMVANSGNNLGRIREEVPEETNPLAIGPDNNPLDILVPVQSPQGSLFWLQFLVKSIGVMVGAWVGFKEGSVGFKVVCWSDAQGCWRVDFWW